MKIFKSIFGFTLIAMMMLTVSCEQGGVQTTEQLVASAKETVAPITPEELMVKIDNYDEILVIDVREPSEYNAGYIPGAVNIPRGVIEFKVGNEGFWDAAMLYMPLKDDKIILYCKKGSRSILAAQTLEKLGFTNVTYITGGWKKWELTYPTLFEKNLDAMSHDSGGEVGGC